MLEVEERRDVLPTPPGVDGRETDSFAASGCSDVVSDGGLAGCPARMLALVKGSDFARMRLRERLRSGGLNALEESSGLGGLKALLPRRRRKINVDFWGRHLVRSAIVGSVIIAQRWERLLACPGKHVHAVAVVVHDRC